MSNQAAGAALASIVFIAFSIWWLLYDQRPPGGGDPARHLADAIQIAEDLGNGDLLAPLTSEYSDFTYPPLVRTVGAIPTLTGLPAFDWATIAVNIVFVPMLVAGCYLVGKLVYGPRAGLLAAIFALGAPMVLSLFHTFLLDAPLAAVVALALWALLTTDNFRRTRQCVIAGALIGLTLLVKTPAPIFLAGPFLVMLIRGGWREWRNLVWLAIAALVVAGPFYAIHFGEFSHLTGEAAGESTDPWTQMFGWTYEGWDRFGLASVSMYAWSAVNIQYLLPLLVLFAIGLVMALKSVRERRFLPELLAGLAVGYLGMSLLAVHDPRYTLPLIVYVAVISTGWIATAGRLWLRVGATAFLALVVALNVATSSLGWLETVKVQLPGSDQASGSLRDLIRPGALTLLDTRGYVVAEPRPDPFWRDLAESAERDGARTSTISVLQGATWGVDSLGWAVFAHEHGVDEAFFDPQAPEKPDLRVIAWYTTESFCYPDDTCLARPCRTVPDGVILPGSEPLPLYVLVSRREPGGELRRFCPG